MGQYGLRNKKELWRHKTLISKFRGIARSLLSLSGIEKEHREEELVNKLKRIGLLQESAGLDGILDLSVEDLLERRLQTAVFRQGLAKSLHQSRQLIVHGHIAIGEQKASSPSYILLREEENKLDYVSTSPISNPDHPLRKSIDELESEIGEQPESLGVS
jgi:small subunit ribosomal protein S4